MMRPALLTAFLLFTVFSFAQTVYITPTGKKYHTKSHYTTGSPTTLTKAKELGYDACMVCKPTSVINETLITSDSSATNPLQNIKPITASQCRGITQAGARCKRMTKEPSGYCFQHK